MDPEATDILSNNPASPRGLLLCSHGLESGPWGAKIMALAKVAQSMGWAVDSIDYRGVMSPARRVAMLQRYNGIRRPLVLYGSSMGGYVAAHACAALKPDGLLLLAPALYFARYRGEDTALEPQGVPANAVTVHGRNDDVVPVSASERFACTHGAALHLTDDGHPLVDSLPLISTLLREVLTSAERES